MFTKSKLLLIAALLPISIIAQNLVWTYQLPTTEAVGIEYRYDNNIDFYGALTWYNNILDVPEYFLFNANANGIQYDSIVQGYDSLFKVVNKREINEYTRNQLFFQRFQSGSIFQDTIYALNLETSNFTEDTLPMYNVNTFTEDSAYFYFIDNYDHNRYYTLDKSTETIVDSVIINPDLNGFKILNSSGKKLLCLSGMHPTYNGVRIRVINKDSLGDFTHDTIESTLSNEGPFKVFNSNGSGGVLFTAGGNYESRVIHIDSSGNINQIHQYSYLSVIQLNNGSFFLRTDSLDSQSLTKFASFHLLDEFGQEIDRKVIKNIAVKSNLNRPFILSESINGYLMTAVHDQATSGDSSFIILFDKNLTEQGRFRLPFVNGILGFNSNGFLLLHNGYMAYYSHNLSASNSIHHPIEIYPNPVQDFIILSEDDVEGRYYITNIQGQAVMSGILPNDGINAGSLKPGVYILNIEGVGYKFIKE